MDKSENRFYREKIIEPTEEEMVRELVKALFINPFRRHQPAMCWCTLKAQELYAAGWRKVK